MIFVGLSIQRTQVDYPFLNFDASRGYIAFFWGIILAEIIASRRLGRKGLLVALTVIISFPVFIYHESAFIKDHINLIMIFVYYTALISFFHSSFIQNLFKWQGWNTLGKISFDQYIWHICCFDCLDLLGVLFHLKIPYEYPLVMIAVVFITFLVGTVSFYLIEEPIRRYTDRFFR